MKNDDVNETETPLKEESTNTTSPEETSTRVSEEPAQPVSTDTTTDDSEPQTPVTFAETAPVTQPTAPKKSRKGLIALIVSIAAVLLLGGGAALAYFFWYQNPDKVLSDALSNAVSANSVEFKASMNIKPAANEVGNSQDVSVNLSGRSNQEAALVDAVIEVTGRDGETVKVESSIVTSEKEAYFKLTNLENVLNVILGAPEGQTVLNTPLGPLVKKVDGSWVKVGEGDLSDVNESYSKTQTCTTELSEKIKQDKSYLNEVGEGYKKNKFIVVKESLGSKTVSGTDSIGFSVEADPAKAKDFIRAIGDTKLGKELSACDDSIDFNEVANDIKPTDQSDGEGALEIWVSRFGHQLTGVNLSAKDDDVEATITSEYTFNKEVKVEKPANALTVKEIIEEYQKAVEQAQNAR